MRSFDFLAFLVDSLQQLLPQFRHLIIKFVLRNFHLTLVKGLDVGVLVFVVEF
eukprot:GAFH01003420.1.p5 GENE.GAFH01003420.1~~GAFH01003420.1.p5  ORF type:complete len:53 (+),score=0.73 GAFH01003420.1:577-735(+)